MRPPRLSRPGAAAPLLALLALAALALLAWPDPEAPPSPPPPAPAAPTASAPPLGRPGLGVPAPSLDLPGPSLGSPRLDPPALSPSLPDVPDVGVGGLGGGGSPSGDSPPAGPEHRTELTHHHHRRWIWHADPSLIVLALLALAVAWFPSRLPRRGRRLLGAAVATGLLALALGAFVAGIDPRPGPGSYRQRPSEVERTDGTFGGETIVTHVDVDHFHPPVDLFAHWLLLGLGLSLFAIRGARVAGSSPGRFAKAGVAKAGDRATAW